MCVPLTFACFFAALVPYKRNGGAGTWQYNSSRAYIVVILFRIARLTTLAANAVLPSQTGTISRGLYRILMMRHERHTMYRCGINTLRNLVADYWGREGGWAGGPSSSCTRMRVDLSSLCMAMSLSLPVLLCDWTFPHYGVINIQYTFYKILYLDNICALCRLSCAPLW